MTWPMHDAGPTTPEPGPRERGREPGPPEPGPDEPGPGRPGRYAVDADPLPPLDGPMPGGGPSPAETTLPLALEWPAPPARPLRAPRFTPAGPSGSVDAPPGWRHVPRTTGYRPPDDLRPRTDELRPRYPQPGYHPPPGAPGAPAGLSGPPGGLADRPQPSRPPGAPGAPATPRSSLVRSSAGMAAGTLVSRATGFLRTLVLVAAIGVAGLGNAYNNANTLPNTVYYLMLGGIFTSVVVPLLVRAAKRDPDRGEAYAQRVFTLGAAALLAVTVVATLLAGPLVDLYAPTIHGPPGSQLAAEHDLMVVWAYYFIPQIFFYGMSSLIGAILNTRGRFAAPMWTPVINNLIVIAVGGLYVVMHLGKEPWNISAGGVRLLGIGTTLGVVAQTVALVPSLRGAGFRWHPALGFRPGEVAEMGRMAGWMSVYVVSQWAGYLVVQIVANAASAGLNGYSAYSIAWQLFQLPYAIIGISVITALLPRMSEHATARRYSLVRDDFSIGVRLASVIVVPASVYLFVLGGPLAEFLIGWFRSTGPYHARYIGEVFGLFALGLVPYMLTQLQLRVFYSFQDSRTAAFVGLLIMGIGIAGNLVALSVLPRPDVVAGLAVTYGIANLAGAIVGWALLLRRVGSLDGWNIARSLTRMHLATVPGLVFAVAVIIGVGHVLHNPSAAYGFVVTVVGGGGAVVLYGLCARALRVAEFGFLARTVTARFGGRSRRH
jgi:murein biosynthesis integral membrane protein MurJ